MYDPEQAGLAALYARLDSKNQTPNPAVVKPVDRKDSAAAKPKQ